MENLDHRKYMSKVIELASSMAGKVSPNPYVACLIVSNNKIISKGVHTGAGNPHAEVEALRRLPMCYDLNKVTLYVNLEPCCHYNKRTAPCAQMLVKLGVKQVVVGCEDPNEEVSGKGIQFLRDNGVNVISGVLLKECKILNKIFFKNMTTSLPYLHAKVGTTLDGKIAMLDGTSKWITSVNSRKKVHEIRNFYDGILVGRKTFEFDNPKLNTRIDGKILKENKKIILGDYKKIIGQIPQNNGALYIIISKDLTILGETELSINNEVIIIKYRNNIKSAFKILYKNNICSIFVEGGSKSLTSLLMQNLIDEISIFKSPKILGEGISFSEGIFSDDLGKSIHLKNVKYEVHGEDIHINGAIRCLQD